jgi:hypothetical protein
MILSAERGARATLVLNTNVTDATLINESVYGLRLVSVFYQRDDATLVAFALYKEDTMQEDPSKLSVHFRGALAIVHCAQLVFLS